MCYCPTAGLIDIISRKWTLCVINALSNHGKLRFTEIICELKSISPKTLAKTLKELEKFELINRETFNTIPPKVEYSLNQKGNDFRKVIYPFLLLIAQYTPTQNLSCCTCSCESCSSMRQLNEESERK